MIRIQIAKGRVCLERLKVLRPYNAQVELRYTVKTIGQQR